MDCCSPVSGWPPGDCEPPDDGWPVLGLEPAFPPLFSCCGNGDSLPPPWLGLGLELGLPPDDEGDDGGDDEGDGIDVPGGCGIDGD